MPKVLEELLEYVEHDGGVRAVTIREELPAAFVAAFSGLEAADVRSRAHHGTIDERMQLGDGCRARELLLAVPLARPTERHVAQPELGDLAAVDDERRHGVRVGSQRSHVDLLVTDPIRDLQHLRERTTQVDLHGGWSEFHGLNRNEPTTLCAVEPEPPPSEIWADDRVTVRRSPIEGEGLFAAEDVAAGTSLLRLAGRLVPSAELDGVIAAAQRGGSTYVDTITIYEDAHLVLPPLSIVHFANHSCDPNLWHVGPYEIAARCDIRAGSELTIDYGTISGADGFSMTCSCGSDLCRGRSPAPTGAGVSSRTVTEAIGFPRSRTGSATRDEPRPVSTAFRTRPARPADAERLREIEVAAGLAFVDVGMPDVAEAEPLSGEELAAYAMAGRSWVAVDGQDEPVGYVIVDIVDGCAHVEQVSVHPDHQGVGLGRRLLDEVDDWARSQQLPALTLTTFADVPWNGPLYAHLGFRPLAEEEIGPELRAVRDEETAHGLDPAQRVCLRRSVPPAR